MYVSLVIIMGLVLKSVDDALAMFASSRKIDLKN